MPTYQPQKTQHGAYVQRRNPRIGSMRAWDSHTMAALEAGTTTWRQLSGMVCGEPRHGHASPVTAKTADQNKLQETSRRMD